MKEKGWAHMKKIRYFMVCFLLLFLVACNQETGSLEKEVSGPITPLMVEIESEGELIVGQPIKLTALVKQNSETIDQLDDIVFEIRQSGKESKEMLKPKHEGSGEYVQEYIFNEKGSYFIIAHVTANGMHVMPEKELFITEK
jgi:hypothetical protein